MMTPIQKSALEALAGRPITVDEASQIEPLLGSRDDVAIAAILSIGRTTLRPTLIGVGTIIEVLGAHGSSGGEFLDALVVVGQTNRDAYWAISLLRAGTFDLSKAASQAQIAGLAESLPEHATGLIALAALAQLPDPVNYIAVSNALNGIV